MGERIRSFNWSATALGPTSNWPQSLRSVLSICLNSSFPMAIYWGSDLRLLYNDEWSPIPGEKHPWALGRPAREAWPEIWHIIEPLFQHVLTTGQATRSRDQLLPMHRHGFTEECYFDYSFSPVRGESGRVDGVFNAVVETTTRVVGERRLKLLRELAIWKTGKPALPRKHAGVPRTSSPRIRMIYRSSSFIYWTTRKKAFAFEPASRAWRRDIPPALFPSNSIQLIRHGPFAK